MFYCVLCEKEVCYVKKFCEKCNKVKKYINLYDDRVYTILDNVLSRDNEKQDNKISVEIKKEIENKNLKLKNHIKRGTNEN